MREKKFTMKTLVYFVRHAEPDYTNRDDMTRPLTEKGFADIKKVTRALIDRGISNIYSSPYKRSYDTIKHFADNTKLDIITVDDFRERKIGEWVKDFRTYSKNQWEDFSFKLLEGECLKEVQERNITALLAVINENIGKSIAIATHGTALSTIINYFNPTFGHADFLSIADKMPYILCFKFDGTNFEAIEEIALL